MPSVVLGAKMPSVLLGAARGAREAGDDRAAPRSVPKVPEGDKEAISSNTAAFNVRYENYILGFEYSLKPCLHHIKTKHY